MAPHKFTLATRDDDNLCICVPEIDQEFWADCGTDSCGLSRTPNCGGRGPQVPCIINHCVIVGG